MSHTSKFEIPGLPRPVTVIHDGDWDGMATVIWEDADGEFQRAELPAPVLIRLGEQVAFNQMKGKIISFLESINSSVADPPL